MFLVVDLLIYYISMSVCRARTRVRTRARNKAWTLRRRRRRQKKIFQNSSSEEKSEFADRTRQEFFSQTVAQIPLQQRTAAAGFVGCCFVGSHLIIGV